MQAICRPLTPLVPKQQTQAVVNQTCYAPYREYVWGLDYIDELISYYENEWVGQSAAILDANYNIVGLAELTIFGHIS